MFYHINITAWLGSDSMLACKTSWLSVEAHIYICSEKQWAILVSTELNRASCSYLVFIGGVNSCLSWLLGRKQQKHDSFLLSPTVLTAAVSATPSLIHNGSLTTDEWKEPWLVGVYCACSSSVKPSGWQNSQWVMTFPYPWAFSHNTLHRLHLHPAEHLLFQYICKFSTYIPYLMQRNSKATQAT